MWLSSRGWGHRGVLGADRVFGSQHGEQHVAATAGQADKCGVVFLSFIAFALVIGPASGEEKRALSLRSPLRAGCSPLMEEPEQWLTGAMPAYAARRAALAKLEASPILRGMRAAVVTPLTPVPGIKVGTGQESAHLSTSAATVLRWCNTALRPSAGRGNTVSAVPVAARPRASLAPGARRSTR